MPSAPFQRFKCNYFKLDIFGRLATFGYQCESSEAKFETVQSIKVYDSKEITESSTATFQKSCYTIYVRRLWLFNSGHRHWKFYMLHRIMLKIAIRYYQTCQRQFKYMKKKKKLKQIWSYVCLEFHLLFNEKINQESSPECMFADI